MSLKIKMGHENQSPRCPSLTFSIMLKPGCYHSNQVSSFFHDIHYMTYILCMCRCKSNHHEWRFSVLHTRTFCPRRFHNRHIISSCPIWRRRQGFIKDESINSKVRNFGKSSDFLLDNKTIIFQESDLTWTGVPRANLLSFLLFCPFIASQL